jgi:Recombinase zinc beta ribbon domain
MEVVMKDRYPVYLDWERFEQVQAMLRDNHAEYQRNQTRGVPRDGAAVLQGIVWCGQCGHKMAVQYKNANSYATRLYWRSARNA